MSTRAVKKVRAILGARLRALRAELGFTQRGLGRRAGLSGKFIGEVERDSLYLISRALRIPLGDLTSLDGHQASMDCRRKRARGRTSRR